jgi:Rrf2 family protein
MLSNSSKYAIKAVLFLALNSSEEKRIMVKDIARLIMVPQAYIAKLLQELARQNIISSKSGPHGGFFLSDVNREQTLINIVNSIDGEKRLQSCVLDLEKCNDEKPCPLHHVVNPTKSKLIEYLSTETVLSFTKQFNLGNEYIPLMDS